MEPTLLYLVSNLMEDRGLRFRFNRDPAAVVREYGLSRESEKALYSMNRKRIFRLIKKEIDLWGFPDDGFPVDPRCVPGGVGANYPAPDPIVRQILPKRVPLSPAGGPKEWRELEVFGQSFPPGVVVTVEDAAGSAAQVQNQDLRGTFRSSILYLQVEAPEDDGTGNKPYTVRLQYDAGITKPRKIPKPKRLVFV